MSVVDWFVFFGFLAYVVWDGLRKPRRVDDADEYFLAGRSVPWWAMGVSILATQASAITMIGTTGLGWQDGMRFLQFYFALPIAMLLLIFTIVPLYHRLRVTTAYEVLGQRFDGRTRQLAALLFLVLRCLSLGFVIYAPSVVLAKILALPVNGTIVATGGVAVLYTSLGGLRAVISTDIKQFAVMTLGLLVTLVVLVAKLPVDVDLRSALQLAEVVGHLEVVDLRWDPAEKYTLWSSLIGGLFLFLSYFGTDQSQVQRYLAGRSLRDKQGALLLNAACKIPFQAMVLCCGVLLFVFYVFHPVPMSFVPAHDTTLEMIRADSVASDRLRDASRSVEDAARKFLNAEAGEAEARAAEFRARLSDRETIRHEGVASQPEVNYVFPHFILEHLPLGLVGLLIAAIFAAALSSIDSELNSMTTVALVDVARRRSSRLSGRRLVRTSFWTTCGIGALATGFAAYVARGESVIEGVNRVGSYVYGSLLGAFVLALIPWAHARGAFWGLAAGMIVVGTAAQLPDVAFLYLNTIGTVTVVLVGGALSLIVRPPRSTRAASDAAGSVAPDR